MKRIKVRNHYRVVERDSKGKFQKIEKWSSRKGEGRTKCNRRGFHVWRKDKMKIIDLGFCPRCKEDLEGMMTRNVDNVKFCYLCSFDIEENRIERKNWVSWAKEYAKNMRG